MNFEFSDKVKAYQEQLQRFMYEHVFPNEAVYEEQLNQQKDRFTKVPPIMEEMKKKAKEEGLWNLFLPDDTYGAGLTNLEYAPFVK